MSDAKRMTHAQVKRALPPGCEFTATYIGKLNTTMRDPKTKNRVPLDPESLTSDRLLIGYTADDHMEIEVISGRHAGREASIALKSSVFRLAEPGVIIVAQRLPNGELDDYLRITNIH